MSIICSINQETSIAYGRLGILMGEEAKKIQSALMGITAGDYGDKYRDHLLAQYFRYLEMTDNISDRRSQANTYFLTINTGIVSAAGIMASIRETFHPLLLIPLAIAGVLLCWTWSRLIRSYRDLNTAKFKVIHEMEKELPMRPFDAEWESVERGENPKLYKPFTHVEKFVPGIFIMIYGVLLIYAAFNHS